MSTEWSLERARSEAAKIIAEARTGADGCPEPLRTILRELIERADPSRTAGGSNYITYMLPVWAGEQAGAPASVCRDLAVGSVYMMLHYFLLDDVMDGEEMQLNSKSALAASQLLHSLFLERYSRHSAMPPQLWSDYLRHTEAWGLAAAMEKIRRADPLDVPGLARKSAPVKIGASAVWLESGQKERILPAEQAVELALASLQLADDWADWREDLASGEERSNAFLTLVRQELGLTEEQPLEDRMVSRAVYQDEVLERLAAIARSHRRSLSELPEAAPGLVWFQQEVLSGIEADARSARQTAMRLAVEGGFSHYLSNQEKV